MINQESKEWFIERVAKDPEYIPNSYIPALELILKRAETALNQAIRNDGIEKIKYQMGWLDGVRETCTLLDGLRKSARKEPAGHGLLSSIFPQGIL